MSNTIPAIFDAGVFRPLEPVDLIQGARVDLQVSSSAAPSAQTPEEQARQQTAIAKFFAVMDALPDEGPADGFSGRDHDRVLYGRP